MAYFVDHPVGLRSFITHVCVEGSPVVGQMFFRATLFTSYYQVCVQHFAVVIITDLFGYFCSVNFTTYPSHLILCNVFTARLLRRARLYHSMSSVRLSVRLSVCDV